MTCARLGVLALCGVMAACNRQNLANVNSRYTVEKVELLRISEARLPRELREDVHKMVGRRYSHEAFSHLAVRIQKQLHAIAVTENMHRGTQRGKVIVTLTVVPRRLWKYDPSEQQFMAAHTGAAGTVVNTLRYHRQPDDLGAGYSLRAAYQFRVFSYRSSVSGADD